MINFATRVADSLADLATSRGAPSTASKMMVTHRTIFGDMGGGEFEWDNASILPHDGAVVIQVTGLATGRWRRIHDRFINPCWFGAIGDNFTDCTAAFQAAYNYASSQSAANVMAPLTSPTIWVPPGTYRVTSCHFGHVEAIPVSIPYVPSTEPSTKNNEIGMQGAGIRKTTILCRSTTEYAFTFGRPYAGVFSGRWTVSDITFHGALTAFGGIDMANCRYSTVERCEFSSFGVNGIGIRASRWCNNISDCTMFFDHVAGTIGISVITTVPYGAVNGFNIDKVKINSAEIGVRMSSPNLANITNCTIDQCRGTGVYIPGGTKGLNIDHNYFEACGQDGLTITRPATGGGPDVTETYSGCIIAHESVASPDSSPISGLRITNNMFAAISTTTKPIITLSGVEDAIIKDNTNMLTYENDSLVELRWRGALYTAVRNFVIDHSRQEDAQFVQLVKFDTDNNLTSCNNIIIRDHRSFSFIKQTHLPILTEPHKWLPAATWANLFEEAPYEGFAVHRLPAGSTTALGGKSYTINLLTDAASSLKGTYFRVNFRTKGAAGLPAGFLLRMYVDEVEAWTLTNPTEDWANVGRGYTFMIPQVASTIRFYIAPNTLTRDVYLTQFSIVPACMELGPSFAAQPSELTGGIYYGNGNPEGAQTATPGKLFMRENGVPGRFVYVKETAIDSTGWRPVRTGAGVVQDNTNGAATLTGNIVSSSDAWRGSDAGAVGFPTAAGAGQIITWNGVGATATDYARIMSWFWSRIDDSQNLWFQRYNAAGVPQGWRLLLDRVNTPVYTGTGTPEGNVIASVGALFLRTDGSAGTTVYTKTSGTATSTGWTALGVSTSTNLTIGAATDAAYVVPGNVDWVILPVVTANRIFTLPAAATNVGKRIYILNKDMNSPAFGWSPSPPIVNPSNTLMTGLGNNSAYTVISDGTDWRLVTSMQA